MTKNQIKMAIVSEVVEMLKPYFPKLTPQGLLNALKTQNAGQPAAPASVIPEKPLTRKETAALLSISLNSVNRYMNTGLLRRIKIGPRLVRIDPASVRKLLDKLGEKEEFTGRYDRKIREQNDDLELERKILKGIFGDEE